MRYLTLFQSESDYAAYRDSADYLMSNVSYCIDDDTVHYNIVKTESGDYKVYVLEKKDISGLTYNMVDLGLPSGLLWADRNVGSSAPEDFGTLFAWGETTGYNVSIKNLTAQQLCDLLQIHVNETLTVDNLDSVLSGMGYDKDLTIKGRGYCKDKCFTWSDYFDGNPTSGFNKYSTNKLTVLESIDDAATINMGSEFRMPTQSDFIELYNNTTTTIFDLQGNEVDVEELEEPDNINNIKGVKYIGSNGNSIFIPFFLFSCGSSIIDILYRQGQLRSSCLLINDDQYSINLGITYGGTSGCVPSKRQCGSSVRGVKSTK